MPSNSRQKQLVKATVFCFSTPIIYKNFTFCSYFFKTTNHLECIWVSVRQDAVSVHARGSLLSSSLFQARCPQSGPEHSSPRPNGVEDHVVAPPPCASRPRPARLAVLGLEGSDSCSTGSQGRVSKTTSISYWRAGLAEGKARPTIESGAVLPQQGWGWGVRR